MSRTVVWFSAGAASAVAAKLTLAETDHQNTEIVYIDTGSEHPDNVRFLADCQKWFDHEITIKRSERYCDTWQVWEERRFLIGPTGALCTTELKKKVRFAFQEADDVQVFGFTADPREVKRAERFREQNPEVTLETPLIERGLTKADCLGFVDRAGIKLPAMYLLGYQNNNCIGCVKGGMGYWNKIRRDFPDVFARMAKLEQSLGHTILRENGQPLPLIALNPTRGRYSDEPEIECSALCEAAIVVEADQPKGRRMGTESTDEIAARHSENEVRNQRLIITAWQAFTPPESGESTTPIVAKMLGVAFLELAKVFHETADAHERSTRRGSKGMSTSYRQAAAFVAGVGQSLERDARTAELTTALPETVTVKMPYGVDREVPRDEAVGEILFGEGINKLMTDAVNKIESMIFEPKSDLPNTLQPGALVDRAVGGESDPRLEKITLTERVGGNRTIGEQVALVTYPGQSPIGVSMEDFEALLRTEPWKTHANVSRNADGIFSAELPSDVIDIMGLNPEPAITVHEVPTFAEPLTVIELDRRTKVHGRISAYIRGDTNAMPPLDIQQTADPFTDPTPVERLNGYAGRRLSVDELMAAPPELPSPDHRSVSQLEEYSDCGLRYRLARRTRGIVQTPAWWNVGGNALHAAIEELERAQAVAQPAPRPIVEQWKHHLGAAITATFADHPDAGPLDRWRAARGGAEGYTWWLVEGERMLDAYVTMRAEMDRLDPGRRVLHVPNTDLFALEWPFQFQYGQHPTQVIDGRIDQVWTRGDGSIEIVDMKFGSSVPTDTFQLGVYAHALMRQWPAPDVQTGSTVITGRYWLGRKGEFTEPVNLLERHPWGEIVYRFTTMDRAERANIHVPRPSSFCRSCAVRGACPIGGRS